MSAAATSSAAPTAHHRRGVALMLVSAAAFTANVLIIRALGQFHAVNVWLISCARFVVGLAIIYAFYPREFAPKNLFTNRKLVGRGLVGGLGVYGTYLTVVELGAGRAILIGNTYVVFAAFMAAIWLGEKLRPVFLVGAVITSTLDNGAKKVPSIFEQVISVDKANLSSTVVADGFHKAADLK